MPFFVPAAPRRATAADWKTSPLPAAHARLTWQRAFTADEHARLAQGLIPTTMEQRWFVYLEGEWLNLHRSWTGQCVFRVRLAPDGDGARVAEVLVARDPASPAPARDEADLRLLAQVFSELLLRR